MSKKSQSMPPPEPSSLLDALKHHTPDDDPWKQSVLYTFGTLLERMDADKKETSKKEKSMSDKLKTLTKENLELKQRFSTLEPGPSSFASQAPPPSNPSNDHPWSLASITDPYGAPGAGGGLFGSGSGRKKKSSVGGGGLAAQPRSGSGIGPLSRTLESLRSICGNPFELPLSSTSQAVAQAPSTLVQAPPSPNLKGSTLAVLPIEVLEHILQYLFLEFHNHDRLNALAGLTDPILYPQPWNPVSLLRVNRVFRALSFPLFYSQIAIDSGRQGSLTLLEMNFISSSSSSSSSFFPDLELIGDDDDLASAGLGGRYEKALESMGIKAKRRAEEQAKPVFRPSPRRLVLFVREERASGAARTSSAFYSSLQSLEEHLSDKYAFLRPSDPPRRPLEEIIVSTRSWLLPSLDVTARILTFIPREVSTHGNDWSSSSLFSMAERASKPSAQHSHMRRNSKEKLSTLQIRLPKASGQASQVQDLEQLKTNFHKLTYVRHLRLDFPFALEEAVVQSLEAILRSPALLPARHFFDGVRTKISFGVLNEAEVSSLRKRVKSLGVGEVVEVEVDVIRF